MAGGLTGHQRITVTVAVNAKVSSAAFVASFNHVALEAPTFTNAITATANVFLQACKTSDGTFRRVKEMGVYSAASGIEDWEVPSSAGDYLAVCRPASRFNYVKAEISNTATAAMELWFNVHN